MKPIIRILSGLSLAIFAAPSIAALNIFACEQEWAALAQELAGDKASVYSATTALQDVHKVEARPSLIARVRSADLLICSGSELEVGWLPLLLTQSGNAKIQLGSAGYFEASQFVPKLEIPKVVDRALGDVHPSGNPHVHLDPRNIARVAEALTERFVQLDPANTDIYKARGNSFRERWRAALSRWEQQAAPLKGVPVVVYHKDMSYFINWSGMREAGSLEPKPGLPPTPAHLAELVERMKREPAKVVVYSAYNSPRAAEFLSERTKIPSVMLPFTVGGTDRAKDLFGLFDDTIGRLLATVK
ncbi:MAG: zinc ABC transporter substrate-binding protein [Betaproteobacteria bacterium]|nr:MAG: zinc ABC transporter substrate-binding protein [Betaproteobacteria bacterium]